MNPLLNVYDFTIHLDNVFFLLRMVSPEIQLGINKIYLLMLLKALIFAYHDANIQ